MRGRCFLFQRKQKACGILYLSLLHGIPLLFQLFRGNTDSHTVKTSYLEHPARARFLRVHVEAWHAHPSLRMEIIGCQARLSQSQCYQQKRNFWIPPTAKRLTNSLMTFKLHCKKRSGLCVPKNEIAQPRSQFPHSCICEGFIYSNGFGPPILLQNRQTDLGNTKIAGSPNSARLLFVTS